MPDLLGFRLRWRGVECEPQARTRFWMGMAWVAKLCAPFWMMQVGERLANGLAARFNRAQKGSLKTCFPFSGCLNIGGG
ncbi:hypothetical protein [Kingella oralis]|uniref:hypothetical protein n=1 Tax=Kingella oralis TaxID=505 RepID=UPI0034E4B715